MTPDMINGSFELFSAMLILLNVRLLLRDKKVQGVSLIPTAFFTLWACWNLFFYSNLEQWYSFYGGIFLLTVNAIWLGLAYKYKDN